MLATFLLMGKYFFEHVFAFQIAYDGCKEDISPNICKRTKSGKRYGIKWGSIGNMMGTQQQNTHWEPIGNMMGTQQKHIGNMMGTQQQNTLVTHWEHDGNTTTKHIGNMMGTQQKKHIGNNKNLKKSFSLWVHSSQICKNTHNGRGWGTNLINATGLGCPMQALFSSLFWWDRWNRLPIHGKTKAK